MRRKWRRRFRRRSPLGLVLLNRRTSYSNPPRHVHYKTQAWKTQSHAQTETYCAQFHTLEVFWIQKQGAPMPKEEMHTPTDTHSDTHSSCIILPLLWLNTKGWERKFGWLCLIYSSPCLRHYCDDMLAVLELQQVLKRGGGLEWGSQGIREIVAGRIIEGIFFCTCLFEKTLRKRGKKQFSTISKLIKRLQFISVSKTNTLTEDGRGERSIGGRLPHIS